MSSNINMTTFSNSTQKHIENMNNTLEKCTGRVLRSKNVYMTEKSNKTSRIVNNTLLNKQQSITANGRTIDFMEPITPQRRYNLRKLSLTIKSCSNPVSNLTDLEISSFSPVRNSTVCVPVQHNISRNASKIQQSNENHLQSNNSTINTRNTGRRNLAHRADVIENLLNLDEDDENVNNGNDKNAAAHQTDSNINLKKTNRFFHRPPAPVVEPIIKPEATKITAKKVRGSRKTKRSVKASNNNQKGGNNIYEFLSQSQTSDSDASKHIDPAADIIQKLITAGKVRVATNCKGKGRPVIKRCNKRVCKPEKRLPKSKAAVKSNEVNVNKGAASITTNNNIIPNQLLSPIYDDEDYYEPELELEPEPDPQSVLPAIKEVNEHSVDGRFSRLARSVLLQQTEKNEANRNNSLADRRRLLEYARSVVSTPAARNTNPLQTSDISPISALPQEITFSPVRPACPSPWRVNEESRLPNVFYFGKNVSHLPSFSCDYIPSTPKKLHTSNKSDSNENATKKSLRLSNIDSILQGEVTPDRKTPPPQLSSFSSNDSNAENMPPPPATQTNFNESENVCADPNEDIVNKRQLPNPHRSHSHRSPLKAINILEVVSLPPWKEVASPKTNVQLENVQETHSKETTPANADDIFGFEELIEGIDDVPVAENKTVQKRKSRAGELHRKLRELKKWRPAEENPILTRSKTIQRVFDDDADGPKQRGIKEMLCSTMINPPKPQPLTNLDSDEENALTEPRTASENGPDLFNDYDPEITFDVKRPHRTYGNPNKKKRKLRHNFVMFCDMMSSSESEEEECEQQRQKRQKVPVKDKTEKPNEDIETFANEFNSMCKEVEDYELIVE